MDLEQPTFETATTRTWFLQTAASSGGAVHEQRVEYAPDSPFPPTHLHPTQDEHFEVERGSMLFVVDGHPHVVEAGGTIDIPRGTRHRARNPSGTDVAVVRWETRPALRTTEFFTLVGRLGDPVPVLASALLADEYQDVFRPTGAVGIAVPVLAVVARMLGHRLPDVG